MDYRSPLENVLNIISAFPQGHDKPIKHAFYNALALFLLFVCVAVGYALLIILEPFLKPLMWALLVGSVLHPFKRSLTKQLQQWFSSLDKAETPFIIGLFSMPVQIINHTGDFIGNALIKHLKIIIFVSIMFPLLHLAYYYTPKLFVNLTVSLIDVVLYLVQFFLNNTSSLWILLALIGYICLMIFLWKPENNKIFRWASLGIWFLISCFISHLFGEILQKIVFILLQTICLVGFIFEIKAVQREANESGHQIYFVEAILLAFDSLPPKSLQEEQESTLDNNDGHDKNKKLESKIEEDKKLVDVQKKPKNPWTLDLFEQMSGEKNEKSISSEQMETDIVKANTKDSITTKRSLFTRSLSQPYIKPKSYGLQRLPQLKSIDTLRTKFIHSEQNTSDFYMCMLLWACGIMLLWKNLLLLPILLLPIAFYFIKSLVNYLGILSWLLSYWDKSTESIEKWYNERYDALVPLSIRGLLKLLYKANISLKNNLKDSVDTIASSIVILALLVFLICASIFIIIQVYAEAIMLVQMTSSVINQTVVHNPELQQLLPPSFDETVDSILDNAYQYGREGLSKAVKGMVADVDSAKSAKLEKQVLELWDRIYQRWMTSDLKNGPVVTDDAVMSTWEIFYNDIKKSPEILNINGLTEFAKQNIGTLKSLLESFWSIIISNVSLILGSFSTFMSVVLGGSSAVLNFILNVIVFLTTLFYLLSSSGELYKPVEFLSNISSSSSRFSLAFEGAINGVFKASFKMAAFYGLWTWLIHNIFKVKIVYLPSAIATILGAVPFLGTYWACIPAVLDLWLAQNKTFSSILFALFQFLPTTIVDTAIYNEIQGGGHPYLTGLAIAGGIFCLGVEGAIIGPLLLCGLYVGIDLSSTLFKESPSRDSLQPLTK